MNYEFDLHYQPIFYVHSLEKPFGHEALLRPRSGEPPLRALSTASDQNMLDMWELRIFERAVDEVLTGMVFINLTTKTLIRRDFILQAERVLRNRGVASSRVCIELSEQHVIDCSILSSAIKSWVEKGFYIALDDFGAGAANFDVLTSCHLDYVKIDRSLVDGVATDTARQSLIKSVMQIIARQSAFPVFEGVERENDLQWIITQNWDAGVQGYALARPAPFKKEAIK